MDWAPVEDNNHDISSVLQSSSNVLINIYVYFALNFRLSSRDDKHQDFHLELRRENKRGAFCSTTYYCLV